GCVLRQYSGEGHGLRRQTDQCHVPAISERSEHVGHDQPASNAGSCPRSAASAKREREWCFGGDADERGVQSIARGRSCAGKGMRETRQIMGMPVTIEICGAGASQDQLEKAFSYFTSIDARFSTYKGDSEISRINRGEIALGDYSPEMKDVFALAEKTKRETN